MRRFAGRKIPLRPTEYVNRFIRIKDGDTGTVVPLTFDERRYLIRPYDTAARRVLLLFSRQTEKSTTLGNKLLALSNMRPLYNSLFVSPSAMQTSVFSKSRLADIIDISPLLKAQTHNALVNNLLEREFINRSKIYLRYAFLNADRIRGLSVNAIFADEIQDLIMDNMPVIEETASRFKNSLFIYSGTPKSFDNTIEQYWSKSSTQSEWVLPCERHGVPGDSGSWHWNILAEKNIGLRGPICERCGGALNIEHPMGQWVEMNPGAEFEGYRVCRLMVPWFAKNPDKWKDIVAARTRYPTAQFMNEVLAISYDSGTKPLTRADVIQACDRRFKNEEDAAYANIVEKGLRCYFGIDWGVGEGSSYTVLSISAYARDDDAIQIVYSRRFDGHYSDPEEQMKEILRLIGRFQPYYVGADYGMGFMPNKILLSKMGPGKMHPFQYVVRAPSKLAYSGKLHRYILHRTAVMSDIFSAIKARKIRFPSWETYQRPYSEDILAIYSEYSETLRMIRYDHARGVPDDTFHSIVYAVLASMIDRRRPDIMAPLKEGSQADKERAEAELRLWEDVNPDDVFAAGSLGTYSRD